MILWFYEALNAWGPWIPSYCPSGSLQQKLSPAPSSFPNWKGTKLVQLTSSMSLYQSTIMEDQIIVLRILWDTELKKTKWCNNQMWGPPQHSPITGQSQGPMLCDILVAEVQSRLAICWAGASWSLPLGPRAKMSPLPSLFSKPIQPEWPCRILYCVYQVDCCLYRFYLDMKSENPVCQIFVIP